MNIKVLSDVAGVCSFGKQALDWWSPSFSLITELANESSVLQAPHELLSNKSK